MKPSLIIVGADKGGVGKTTITRALIDYLDANGVANRAFDTENEVPGGVLKRFFPDRVEIVDLADSDGQMRVFDTLGSNVTVIDIRAGLLSPTLKMLAEIGFLDPSRFSITVLHVVGNNQQSIDEVGPVAERLAGLQHILVGNRTNDTKFVFPAAALDIPMLSSRAAEAVDQASAPFSVFAKGGPSAVLSGAVSFWLNKVFAQFKGAQL